MSLQQGEVASVPSIHAETPDFSRDIAGVQKLLDAFSAAMGPSVVSRAAAKYRAGEDRGRYGSNTGR
jgi:hypothetical protein